MDRWDIFTIYMVTFFGGIGTICLCTCCFAFVCLSDDNNSNDNDNRMVIVNLFTYIFAIIWAIGLIALWIWGIAVIANKDIKDGNGCNLI